MVATGHTAVGVIVGVTAYHFFSQGDLATGLVLTGAAGVAFHYLSDFIPHGHFFMPKDFKKYIVPVIILDVILPAILFLGGVYLKNGLGEKFLYVMFGIGGSQIPDVLDGLIYTAKLKRGNLLKTENNFHQGLHWHGRGLKTLLLGFRDVWQILIILVALYFVLI